MSDDLRDEISGADMTVCADRNVTSADLAAVFTIFLGRAPDDPQEQNAYWETRQLSELLRVFAASVEFGHIGNTLADSGLLTGGSSLSRADRTQADLWLGRISQTHRSGGVLDWADLLLAGVTCPELNAMGGPVLTDEALTALTALIGARRESRAVGLQFVSFDADAFLSKPANRPYRGLQNEPDFDAPIERSVVPPVTLRFFTQGLDAIPRAAPLTLARWLEATQDAALAGALTHWLWDETTYRRNRAVPDRGLDDDATQGLAYLDMLTVGDAAGASPHPLFCPYAYGSLNQEGRTGEGGPFRHFVEFGEDAGFRTSALFDPDFYIAQNPQVAMQIAAGLYASPLEHFVRVGLTAGHAFCPDFDRHFYLTHHPDVAQAIADGSVPSAEWHYVFLGAREGRPPNLFFNPWYYAERYPFIFEEMARLGIASTFEHFMLLGRARGWSVNPPLLERRVAPDDGRALFEKRGRRAYGEIMDGGITIPPAKGPRLSVIVPVFNQADLTAGLLKAAAFAIEVLQSRRGIETEILIIDSGSTDHTEALLATLPHVVRIRPTRPFSFPAAVNAGAARARGDVLLVVNNDIEFQPDAFDRVFAALDGDPDIGILGAKIILPNETLQEVGATLDRLGNVHGGGREADAYRVKNNRRLTVDYASGCFLAFRRSEFDALSGFEEAFSPGYYEDVDFALRMKRDLAKSTVVDTGLCVTHYENASFAKGRPPTVNMAAAGRNRLLLKSRHAARFQGMGPTAPGRHAESARKALSGACRVLIVQDAIPAACLGSRFGRLEAILDTLTGIGVGFDVLALNPTMYVDSYKDPRVRIFRSWMHGDSLQEVLQRHGSDYSHVWVCRSTNVAEHAAVLIQAKAEYGFTLICDVEALAGQEFAELKRIRGETVDASAQLAALAHELVVPVDIDCWVTVDEHQRSVVEKIGLGPVAVVGTPANQAHFPAPDRSFADRHRVLFVGSGFEPGKAEQDALEWLLAEVWPQLADLTGARLTIVGEWTNSPATSLLKRLESRLDRLGPMDQRRFSEIYAETRVAVVPHRLASDQFATVAAAISAGAPCVMTDTIADRLGGPFGAGISRAPADDGGHAFADWLIRLYSEEATWRGQVKKQRAAVAKRVEAAEATASLMLALGLGELS